MSVYTPYLDWLNDHYPAMVALVEDWSRINSGSYHLEGLARMADTLGAAFAPLGGAAQLVDLAPLASVDRQGRLVQRPLGRALSIVKRPQAPCRVLLAGHMDTVFPADSHFQNPRWLDDNILNGPGVADLKGGLVVMLHALLALERSPWAENVGWEVLLNPDEEIGSLGSAPLLEAAARRNHIGLIYEPALADGTLAGARKGSGNYTLVVHGRAAHAGRDHHLGRNAIVLLAEGIVRLDALNGQRPGVTVNPGHIEGGGPVNIVPDLAILRFNIRVASHEEQHWVERELHALVDELSGREGFQVELHGRFGRPPKLLDERQSALFEQVRECGAELGLNIRWAATGGCCDGNNLAAAGLPNVDTLGVRGGKIHSDEEFLLADSLVERARLSALLLMKIGAGEIRLPLGA
ncbi:MAG TPA: hydrolase [Candidatus Competibacteraceae bacterium]|nr:hydrolase [Candidatus Competibacteraceae bacterium]